MFRRMCRFPIFSINMNMNGVVDNLDKPDQSGEAVVSRRIKRSMGSSLINFRPVNRNQSCRWKALPGRCCCGLRKLSFTPTERTSDFRAVVELTLGLQLKMRLLQALPIDRFFRRCSAVPPESRRRWLIRAIFDNDHRRFRWTGQEFCGMTSPTALLVRAQYRCRTPSPGGHGDIARFDVVNS